MERVTLHPIPIFVCLCVALLLACLLRRVEISPAVSFGEHFVEMSLSIPQSAVDGLVQILSLLSFEVAAAPAKFACRVGRSGRLSVSLN